MLTDNLRTHKSVRMREMLAARGCRVWYLPSYSPDYSPIVLAFAKIKAELRRVAAHTREALENAIAQAIMHISSAETAAVNYSCHPSLQAQS